MKNFLRALRYAWPYRGRIGLAWLCALAIAVLWAGSISFILPLFNLLFEEPLEGIRFERTPVEKQPGQFVYLLRASKDWTVVENAPVPDLQVEGRTVRAPARVDGIPVEVVPALAGLERAAAKAEQNGEVYAPVLKLLADLLPRDRFRALAWIMVAVIVMTILRGLLLYLNEYLVGHAVNRAILSLRLRVYEHVLRGRLTIFSAVGASDMMSRFQQDVFLVTEGMKTVLGKTFREPFKALFCVVGAVIIGVSINPWLPVLVLVAAPLVGYMVQRFARIMRRASRKQLESFAQMVQILEESLFGIRIVKGYRLEGHERRRFFQMSRRLFKQLLRAIRVDAVTSPAVETIFTIAAAGAVLLGGSVIMTGGLGAESLAKLTTFFGLLVGAMDPVRKLSNVSNRVQQAASGADRLFALLDQPAEPRYGLRGRDLARHSASIAFDGVSFEYEKGKPILRDIDLEVRHGEVVAIIGRTGCGKTTLVSLLPRFFEPTGGRILIDGTSTQDVTLRSLRNQIAIVPQETTLFAESVERNIALGALAVRGAWPSREEVVEAARAAHADAFIQALPQGYDTVIGEHGTTLSGGERQRLALARAIIRDPAILILDEATSALDEETQMLVQETLQRFVEGRTTFLIAHRLTTLTIADRIVVMDAGRIVDVGTHDELLETCALYRRLREVGLDGV